MHPVASELALGCVAKRSSGSLLRDDSPMRS
jgi:hypothetical protein